MVVKRQRRDRLVLSCCIALLFSIACSALRLITTLSPQSFLLSKISRCLHCLPRPVARAHCAKSQGKAARGWLTLTDQAQRRSPAMSPSSYLCLS
ncbi:hypothetical protein IWZ03DRAFT_383734 [Phyllosticta citriasiana]|uniref:Secreted protein n=1 Tax=Phyllosticta citriasiana TaxID=595635 RepID=A0ABR1KL89_9PEZI